MSLFLISGTAGTGKSQVCRVLKERGYEAYDTDDDGLARWQHKETGYIHPKSSIKPYQRTPQFLAAHSWNVPKQYVEELAKKAQDHPIFLCGSLGNEAELYNLFTTVFALYVDDVVLKYRLDTRTTNDWGKQPQELAQTLERHHRAYKKYEQLGVIIDASQPLEAVVDEILSNIIAMNTIVLPDTFWRVSVKALIFDNHNHLLVSMDRNHKWEIPGGSWEYKETLEDCIRRELKEELQVTVAHISGVIFCYKGNTLKGNPKINIAVKVIIDDSPIIPSDDNLIETRFVSKEELLQLSFQSGEGVIKDYVDQIWA